MNFLQAILLQLLESHAITRDDSLSKDRELLFQFQILLEEQYEQNRTVGNYVQHMGITEKRLSTITKKHLGMSPLQIIHNRLLLEAKRLLLFDSSSHKEIAYQLGFDSPASFSQFIKNKTGLTPSELPQALAEIHKQ